MARYIAPERDVADFLRRFWDAMGVYGLDLWPNTKNNAFEVDTGFTKDDAELLVRSLRTIDYSFGPEDDDNPNRPPGEVWKFSREFEGTDMYVKLKLEYQPYVSIIPSACMSFHPQDPNKRPLDRPHWPRRGGK